MRLTAVLFCVIASQPALALEIIPLTTGEYIKEPCTDRYKSKSIGIYQPTNEKGSSAFITPSAETADLEYCDIKKIKKTGNVYSGSAPCHDSGRISTPSGTYKFSFTVINEKSFISRGITYHWCAPNKRLDR